MIKKRPTLRDVAKLAGVSKATAARVVGNDYELVSEPTRERVLTAVQQLRYERHAVAGSLRSERTYMIALSIPDITNPFWPEVARGVQDTVENAGYTVVLMNNDWNVDREEKHLRKMRQNQFDGLIINPTGTLNSDLIEISVPVVLLASGESYPDFDTVSSDSAQAGELAMEHLLGLGHRRIALIAGPLRRRKSYTHRDTYLKAHREHGLDIDPALIIQTTFTQEGGYDAMQQLLAMSSPPTAVFAVNDIIALGALRAVQTVGLHVPEAMSIIGMDDIFAATTAYPPLTTIAKPKYAIGVTAARFLLARIEGKKPADTQHTLLSCSLVQRSSTASLK
ncbi:MAG: LacI family DNA-binding transcriptional regulator [Chitinophagaceae bacterium]|nr:LacI family DNA-binding transcriptional regulator [Anaerolineae bacterium]